MNRSSNDSGPVNLAGRSTISVAEAGGFLGIGRTSAYEAVRLGQLPVLKLGGRYRVPVPRLLALLGVDGDAADLLLRPIDEAPPESDVQRSQLRGLLTHSGKVCGNGAKQ